MRHNLYMFRHSMRLKQSGMAERIGCTRNYYCLVETGRCEGKQQFWSALQRAFNIPDSKMYPLMKEGEVGE